MVVVRPWKLPAATMILAWSAGTPLTSVAPLAGDLDRGLDGLGAGVHRQHEVLAAQVAERGGEVGELVVHERAAGQREPVELGVRGREQARVAVAEVQRRVAGQQVEVAAAVDVGHPGALGVGDHDRQRVVVVRGALLGARELLDRGRSCGRGAWWRSCRASSRLLPDCQTIRREPNRAETSIRGVARRAGAA